MANLAEKETRLDEINRRLLNKRWVAIVVLFVTIVVGAGAFTDAITKITTFVAGLASTPEQESGLPGPADDDIAFTSDIDLIAEAERSQPDLTIASIGDPWWDSDSKLTRIQIRVKNIGTGFAEETLVKVIDGSTTNPTTNSSYETIARLPALRAGSEYAVTVTFPYWVLNPNAELQVLVDPANSVYESDEDNNSMEFRKVG